MFDPSRLWAERNNHNSLIWRAVGKGLEFPYVTAHTNDFRVDVCGEYLKNFFITFYFKANLYKPVHVHYYVGRLGEAVFSYIDSSLSGGKA